MKLKVVETSLFLILICACALFGAESIDPSRFDFLKPASVTDLTARDVLNDEGGRIRVSWTLSVDDTDDYGLVDRYLVYRSENVDSGFVLAGSANHGEDFFIDKGLEDDKQYYYRVVSFPYKGINQKLARKLQVYLEKEFDSTPDSLTAVDVLLEEKKPLNAFIRVYGLEDNFVGLKPVLHFGPGFLPLTLMDLWRELDSGNPYYLKSMVSALGADQYSLSEIYGPAQPAAQWFNMEDLDTLVIGLIICLSVVMFIAMARGGRELFLRKIGGLQAIDEAIGRATEMGKSILFIPGIQDMDDVQTVAGITILGRVARTIASYDTKINMPVSRSIVMTTARETIKEAYLAEGRPEAYSDDMVHYLTDEQFGYVAAVDGIMVRERPATCFYLGAFFAESLIMAETGNSIGAIQIAGTAMPAQLPFFVAACDYTLIGEELFAASAYLSGEPKQLGSIKGQDVGKFIAMLFIIVGAIIVTLASITGDEGLHNLAETIKSIFGA